MPGISDRKGLPLVVLYPGIVLGAGDEKASGQYIQDIIRRRVPSTIFHHSCATYVYVEDVVEAMLRAAEKPETVGQKYLIGKYNLDGRSYAALNQPRIWRAFTHFPLPGFHGDGSLLFTYRAFVYYPAPTALGPFG